eukprot:PhF_6_TR40254/c0_g1_i7/m.59942/K08220/FLVCR, SLC49A1_2; MFS transporter, FLVCR family, feline leukemia virus subgroup C receptor-related protein
MSEHSPLTVNLNDQSYVTYTTRWTALGLFSCLSATNGCLWISHSAIFDITRSHYGASSFAVNMFSTSFMFVFVACVYPALLVFRRLGLRRGLIMAAFFNAAGALIKMVCEIALGSKALEWVLFGQLVGSLSNALYLGVPPLLAAVWFSEKERSLATAVAALANNFGASIGFFMPPLIVSEDGSGFVTLYAVIFGMCVVPLIGIVLFVPEKPPTPPSVTSSNIGHSEHSTHKDLLTMLTRPYYWCVLVSTAFMVGTLYGSATLLPQHFYTWNGSSSDTGWCGFGNLIAGIVASIFIGMYVDKYRSYKNPAIVLSAITAAFLVAIILTCFAADSTSTSSSWILMILFVGLGLAQTGVIPVVVEFAVELTYPLDEILCSVMLFGAANLVGVIIVVVGGEILGDNPTAGMVEIVWIIILVAVIASMGLLWWTKPIYHRVASEELRQAARTTTKDSERATE